MKKFNGKAVGEIWFDHAANECFYRDNGSISCRTVNDEPTMTIQSEADKCDLNIIRSIYEKSGIMNNIRTDQPKYGDFTSSADYHELLFRAQQAEDDFMMLPALLRERFSNDPGKLLDFVADPKNAVEAVELGLMMPLDVPPQASQVPMGENLPPS